MRSGALLGLFFCVGFLIALSACSPKSENTLSTDDSAALRPLTDKERSQDFDHLLDLFKSYYGPYQYKEKNLGVEIESLAKAFQAKALNAKTDEELAGYVMQFGAALQDGHVQIQIENTASGVSRYKVPIVLTPIEGHAIIGEIKKELKEYSGLDVGDEILEVDGQSPFELLKTAQKYRMGAMPMSNQHLILFALSRPSYMTDLVPKSPVVLIKALKANGTPLSTYLTWELDKYNSALDRLSKNGALLDMTSPLAKDFDATMDSYRTQIGQVNPIFLTPEVQNKFKFVKVYPSDAARKKYGLQDKETPPIYAALYRHQGKNVLLVRIATYSPSDFKTHIYMKAYMALMDEYEDMADVLVLDQTHNPGGSYCAEFYNIFANDNDVQSVAHLRADRKWINDLKINWPAEIAANPEANPYDGLTTAAWGLIVEKAYDEGKFMTGPMPLFSGSDRATRLKFQWKKPMLVLIDSLAGSCGDLFPMLVKANKRAKLFGEPTMGLGGNVEEVGVLPHSRIHIRMTRSLFFPLNTTDFVENRGVTPDYPYSISLKDFRAGMIDYVKAFSDKALEQ